MDGTDVLRVCSERFRVSTPSRRAYAMFAHGRAGSVREPPRRDAVSSTFCKKLEKKKKAAGLCTSVSTAEGHQAPLSAVNVKKM